MKFFVIYGGGDCNDGSHTCGITECATRDEAILEAEKWQKYFSVDDYGVTVIEGNVVQEKSR